MKIGDVVKVKPTWHSDMYEKYWRDNLHGKKGKIVELISDKDRIEGYRVKFPSIKIQDTDGEPKIVENFIWPFYAKYIEPSGGVLNFVKRRRRNPKQLKSIKATAWRLKKSDFTLAQISERLEAPIDTIKNWLYK